MINSDMAMAPDRKIVKARVKLVQIDTFFGSRSLRLKPRPMTPLQVARSRIRTMATDGVSLIYNPKFVQRLTISELIADIAHETLHVVMKHMLRRNGRDFKLWNVACDYAINGILKKAGYDIANYLKYDPRFDGMSAEKIYNILVKERDQRRAEAEAQAAQVPEPYDDDDEDITFDYGDGDDDDGDDGDEDDNDDDGDDDDGDEDDNDGGDADEEVINYALPDFDDDGYDPDDEDAFPQLPEEMEDFSSGVVLDAPDSLKTQEAEEQLDLENQAAAHAADTAGNLPGDLKRLIESQNKHKIDYKDLIRDWLQKNLFPSNYTWKKPNRRFSSSEMNLPVLDSEYEMPKIGVAVDESGSVTDEESAIYADEVNGVLSEFQCMFTAIYFDETVRTTKEFSVDDLPIKFEIEAGGGTRFMSVFKYIKENDMDIDVLLFFTDMGAWDWDELEQVENQPNYPVMWMNTDRDEDDMEIPFGIIVPLEID